MKGPESLNISKKQQEEENYAYKELFLEDLENLDGLYGEIREDLESEMGLFPTADYYYLYFFSPSSDELFSELDIWMAIPISDGDIDEVEWEDQTDEFFPYSAGRTEILVGIDEDRRGKLDIEEIFQREVELRHYWQKKEKCQLVPTWRLKVAPMRGDLNHWEIQLYFADDKV